MEKEYFDIYTADRKRTGRTMARKDSFLREGEFQLIVLAVVENQDHHFAITRRALDKKWAAGDWECSGGGVQAGETSLEAVCREVREETGLDVTGAEGGCVYTYSNVDLVRGDNYFVDIYHFHMNFGAADIRLQESEAIGFQLVPFSEIRKLGTSGHFLHYERILQAFEAENYYPEG